MSRTNFALRFKSIVGVPPMTYLSNWRMHLAQRALLKNEDSMSTIAESLGYGSESAFSHAFKKTFGISPKHYREMNVARSATT